ncbi:MAG: DUF6970 domain-containing protein [Burkholderiaceae bacterium]
MNSIRSFAAISSLILVSNAGCAQQPPAPAIPEWLQAKIAEYQRLPPSNPPRQIVRTTHEGRTVYYVFPTCCDIPSELYDEEGRLLCRPSGGFAGGDGRCPSFTFANAMTPVWRDSRFTGSVADKQGAPAR